MKTIKFAIIFIVTVFSINSFSANSQNDDLTCSTLNLVVGYNEDTGEITWEKYDVQLSVVENSKGKYNYMAKYIWQEVVNLEPDTKITPLPKQYAQGAYDDNKASYFTKIPREKIASAMHANIGVKANKDDAYGLELIVFKDSQNKVLGKILRVGWGIGVCLK